VKEKEYSGIIHGIRKAVGCYNLYTKSEGKEAVKVCKKLVNIYGSAKMLFRRELSCHGLKFSIYI